MQFIQLLLRLQDPLLPSGLSPGPTVLPSAAKANQKEPAVPKFPVAAAGPRKRGRVPQVDADPENPRPGKGSVLAEVAPAVAAAPAAAPASTAAGAAVAAAGVAAAAALEAGS